MSIKFWITMAGVVAALVAIVWFFTGPGYEYTARGDAEICRDACEPYLGEIHERGGCYCNLQVVRVWLKKP